MTTRTPNRRIPATPAHRRPALRRPPARAARRAGTVLTLVLAAAALALPAAAQDRAEVAPSQIIGNRELPKVLYIVPWKKPLPDPLSGKPPASVLDEALAPIDRDVFRRQQRYQAEPAPAAAAATAATAGSPAAKP